MKGQIRLVSDSYGRSESDSYLWSPWGFFPIQFLKELFLTSPLHLVCLCKLTAKKASVWL